MQNFFVLLFLLLFFGGCDSPQPQPVETFEVTFHRLSPSELELFYQDLEMHDTLKRWFMEEEYLKMVVKNNTYDWLRLYLAKFGKNLVYRSDVISKYRVENDSLMMEYSDIRCFMKADSIVCLEKGQSATVFFEGRCADQRFAYEYSLSFYGDSTGAGKERNIQFRQFPCGNSWPKKKW